MKRSLERRRLLRPSARHEAKVRSDYRRLVRYCKSDAASVLQVWAKRAFVGGMPVDVEGFPGLDESLSRSYFESVPAVHMEDLLVVLRAKAFANPHFRRKRAVTCLDEALDAMADARTELDSIGHPLGAIADAQTIVASLSQELAAIEPRVAQQELSEEDAHAEHGPVAGACETRPHDPDVADLMQVVVLRLEDVGIKRVAVAEVTHLLGDRLSEELGVLERAQREVYLFRAPGGGMPLIVDCRLASGAFGYALLGRAVGAGTGERVAKMSSVPASAKAIVNQICNCL